MSKGRSRRKIAAAFLGGSAVFIATAQRPEAIYGIILLEAIGLTGRNGAIVLPLPAATMRYLI